MISPRQFLLSGLLAGLFAGIAAAGVAFVVGEPSVNAAISIEEAGGAHDHASGETHDHGGEGQADGSPSEVPRSLQSTAGLLTATVVTGTTLGGLVGVLAALALGRLGLGVRGSTMLVTATGFVAVYLLPFVAYPPNPPAVGEAASIGYRTALYFILVAISVIAAAAAVAMGARLRTRIGGWYATLSAIAGYLAVMGIVLALMPRYDEVPAGFPAELLYDFRGASLLTQLTLWGVLGVVLAELANRAVVASSATAAGRNPVPSSRGAR